MNKHSPKKTNKSGSTSRSQSPYQSPYQRLKQPELVKSELLKAALSLSLEKGLTSLTVQAVAERAGVTKGGLLHHFNSKEALIDSVFAYALNRLENELDEILQKTSPTSFGRFTRAWVDLTFSGKWSDNSNPIAALTISVVADPRLRGAWNEWMTKTLKKHKATDDGLDLEIIRLAADGAWLNSMDGGELARSSSRKLRDRLLKMID